MKKIILLLSFACISMYIHAQGTAVQLLGDTTKKASMKKETSKKPDAKKADVKKAEVKKGPWYNCPQCMYSDNKPGKCPVHKLDLIKEGMWHCPMSVDDGVGEVAGRCPKCGMQMVQMEYRDHKDKPADK